MPFLHPERKFDNMGIFIVHIYFIDHIHVIRLLKVKFLQQHWGVRERLSIRSYKTCLINYKEKVITILESWPNNT